MATYLVSWYASVGVPLMCVLVT